MAEQKLGSTIESLFNGMSGFMSSKTVVGEVVHIGDKIIVPLIDVSFGVGAGVADKKEKDSAVGGLGGKMSPTSVLVISSDGMKMLPVNPSQDVVSKLIDVVPELISKFTNKGKKEDDIDTVLEKVKENENKSVTE